MRWVPRGRKPTRSNGMSSASQQAIDTWTRHKFAQSVYQFEHSNMVRCGSQYSVASAEERELLMGFPRHHTLPALPSGQMKADPFRAFAVRASLMGNSFQVRVVTMLLSHLACELGFLPRPLEPWEAAAGRESWTVGATEPLPPAPPVSPPRQCPERLLGSAEMRLGFYLANRVSGRGSDLRVTTGQPASPHRLAFQSTDVSLWRWRTCISARWARPGSSITEMEIRAWLLAFRRRTRQRNGIATKFIHLLDSMAALGALTRRRTSSRQLSFLVRRSAALELASSSMPLLCYVRSARNPADKPSRRGLSRVKKKPKDAKAPC